MTDSKQSEFDDINNQTITLEQIDYEDPSYIDIKDYDDYPHQFLEFCMANNLRPPGINSGRGKALLAMILNPGKYWKPEQTIQFCEDNGIKTRDSIQLFNKNSQWGLAQSPVRGIYYIPFPYETTIKPLMRQNFGIDITEDERNERINNHRDHIRANYVDIPNDEWQMGHRNPESPDNSESNLILQPPIQAKYRDRFIFIDVLTRIPTPAEFIRLYEGGRSPYNNNQLRSMRDFLNSIDLDSDDEDQVKEKVIKEC